MEAVPDAVGNVVGLGAGSRLLLNRWGKLPLRHGRMISLARNENLRTAKKTFLSHRQNDHTGGLPQVLNLTPCMLFRTSLPWIQKPDSGLFTFLDAGLGTVHDWGNLLRWGR
jgi:hypothetical protein